MSIDIDALSDRFGLTVTDHIEHTTFELYTDRPVSPTPSPTASHYFPVDRSVTVEAGWVEIPRLAQVAVRDGEGTLLARGEDVSLPSGRYCVGITPAPTKLYLGFECAFSAVADGGTTRIEFDEPAEVTLGFRSLHQAPAGTITTPTDPRSLMDAVSLLGSALKTLSPERAFPTLRGHPPLIEPGDAFRVPDRIDPPDSGVRIVVPPAYRALYPVVPLAYYLAAEVVPGSPARIEGDGWTHSLAPDIERRAADVLRQSFHFDCIARTEGFYPVDLHERAATAADLDWASLYEAPLAERLGTYLDVPFDRIEPELPRWTLTTDVRPGPDTAEALPFVAAELSLVRSPETVAPASADAGDDGGLLRTAESAALVRGAADADDRAAPRGADAPSDHGPALESADFVRPEPVETVGHAWVGDGVPLDANKATLDAYRRRLETEPVEQSRISVLVACNDEQMREEGAVSALYGLRDIVQFDIEMRHDLTRAEMRETLASDADFLHYIGHVDDRGMQCRDGYLDLTGERLTVGISAFLLNACQSYEQGAALVRRGSRGGIVTLSDVANAPATRLGRIVARLLNGGFDLRTALHVARRELLTGRQYIVVGDGATTICQSRSGMSIVAALTREDDGRTFSAEFFPNKNHGIGSLAALNMPTVDEDYYVPATARRADADRDSLARLFDLEVLPVFVDGELAWSDEVDLD